MVDRASSEVEFKGGRGVQVRGTNIGNARVDLAKYSVTNELAAPINPNHSSDALLGTILKGVGQLAEVGMRRSMEEAYLDGAAKAGTIKSEEELESDPLTRAWRTAGYRDTMGRVALAEKEARLAADMPKLREQTPDKFNEYLTARRAELMPQLEGMSTQQRQATFQNLLLNDRAAIKKHAVEHAQFQIETETRSIQAAGRVSVAALDRAKADAGAYRAATDSTFGMAYSAIVQNPKLNGTLRAKMLEELASYALASDHQDLYRMINEEPVDLPDGSKGPMAMLLTWDDSVKLSKQFRESRARTEAFRAKDYVVNQARMQADWDNPDTPLMPEKDVLAFADEGVQRGLMSADQYKSFMQDYYNASAKKAVQGPLAAAWAAGDTATLISLNKTDEEGFEAYMATMGRKMKPAELVGNLATIGIVQGRPTALKEMGKLMAPALAQLSTSETADPANAAMLAQTIRTLDAAEKAGKAGVYEAVMSTYPAEMQSKLMSIREGMRLGLSPEVAIGQANHRALEEAKLTPQQREAIAANNAKEDVELLNSLEPKSFLGMLGLRARSIFSTDAGNQYTITARSGWAENEERVAEVNANMKFQVAQELNLLSRTHPFMSADARKTAALAAVAGRTVETVSGPFVIPRGQTLQSFFGVPGSTGQQRVGAALDEFVKPGDGNRIVFTVGTHNQLMFRELGAKGQLIRDGVIDPRQVAPMVAAQQEREAAQFRVNHGVGKTHNGFTYNGDNSVGMSNSVMLKIRDMLTEAPAINTSFANPEKLTPQARATVNEYFKVQTDMAVKASQLPMRTTGRNSVEALALFAELNVLTDNKFTQQREYRDLLQALKGNDSAAALKAMADTALWKKTSEAHRSRYTALINKIIKG